MTWARQRRSKYGAVRTTIDGITFASKREAIRYATLRQMQTVGLISRLELQPRFRVDIEGVHICDYIADFAYFRDNARVVEDVKSKATRTPVYVLKKKLVESLYRISIIEVA